MYCKKEKQKFEIWSLEFEVNPKPETWKIMIKVLIVEDSRVVSEYLEYILNSDPQIQVIGNVSNGKQAIDFIKDRL